MMFLNLRCSTTVITYLILIQVSIGCAGPVRSSRKSLVTSPVISRRSDQQSGVIIQVTTTSDELLIATTELPLEKPVEDEKGPTELLQEINNFSGPSVSGSNEMEDVTESIPEPNHYLPDPSLKPSVDVVKIPQVSSEAPPVTSSEAPSVKSSEAPPVTSSETPMDLPLFPAVHVPTAPSESNSTKVAASVSTLPAPKPVVPPKISVQKTKQNKVEIVTPPSTELPFYSPVKIPKPAALNKTVGGAKKNKTSTVSLLSPQVTYTLPKYRPIATYNPPDSINPYLGEEQDKPIYLPPTFTGPAALPVPLYSSSSSEEEEDNFPKIRPFGPSKPKKLDFPPISNTDENFGYQIDWW